MAKYSYYPETLEENNPVTKEVVAEHFGMTVEELAECSHETVEEEISVAAEDWRLCGGAYGCNYGILDLETGKVVRRFTLSVKVTFK